MTDTPDKIRDDIVAAIRDQSLDIRGMSARMTGPVWHLSRSLTRPADTNAYAANDAFANSTSAPEPGGFQFIRTGSAIGALATTDLAPGGFAITDGIVVASAATSYTGEIWLFDTPVTAINDNAAFAISDAEALTVVGVIPFVTSDTTSNNAISYVTDINIRFLCDPAALRFLVKIMNTPTPGSAEVLSIKLKYQPMRPVG